MRASRTRDVEVEGRGEQVRRFPQARFGSPLQSRSSRGEDMEKRNPRSEVTSFGVVAYTRQ